MKTLNSLARFVVLSMALIFACFGFLALGFYKIYEWLEPEQ